MRILSRYPTRYLVIAAFISFGFILHLTRLVDHHDISPTWGPPPKSDDTQETFSYKSKHQHGDEPTHDESRPVKLDRLSLEELKTLVSGKKGYYVRDWSVGLGWNNMKYIIEAALIQAKLLDRVLVIPSFVYARNCEYDIDVCSEYALMVNREDAVGWDKWNGAPLNTNAWQLPIELMLDLPKLRSYYPVILTPEFMQLHNLDTSNELLTGQWNRDIHKTPNMTSFHVIPNHIFDNDIFRVDTTHPFPSKMNESMEIDTEINAHLREAAGEEKNPLSWDNAVQTLRNKGHYIDDDETAEKFMNRGGWIVTYTYEGLGGMEYTRTVAPTIRQVLPRSRVHGWVEDFTLNADVLFLEGETHLSRKPGGFRFTTLAARDDYTHFVLTYMRPIGPLIALSEKIARRMTGLADGRAWLSAHMRRGDFTVIGWVKDKSLESHLKHVQEIFEQGRKRLVRQVLRGGMPREDDPYFIATDERNSTNLDYMRQNGAVIIYDLLTIEDRREIGWPLLFTDVLGIVEQRVAASSAFFYGHALSSLAGGVVNIRTTMGFDSNTWIID
ncbi:hypothetical protein Clacol_008056 [Clathrus columnatus]|uniref:Peptide-O-fucosyltransferase n=1 Tax=Clathrus columnatus TaxID=1419009 RepID=A0AAV5AGN6_9AGAM|nr:hypothetical protein Clacol_008056 [Clathrus columnatus]